MNFRRPTLIVFIHKFFITQPAQAHFLLMYSCSFGFTPFLKDGKGMKIVVMGGSGGNYSAFTLARILAGLDT